MCDDLGWADLNIPRRRTQNETDTDNTYWRSTFGTAIGEPGNETVPWAGTDNIAAFAAEGMRFNRFYSVAPVCSPTRISFLTGRYHERMEVTTIQQPILNRELTIPEIAKTLGYSTAHFGKWHLGRLNRPGMEPDGDTLVPFVNFPNHTESSFWSIPQKGPYSAPWHHGYDEALSFSVNVRSFDPYGRRTGLRPTSWFWREDGTRIPDDGSTSTKWTSEILTGEAKSYIESQDTGKNDDIPFFVTVWLQAGHEVWNSENNPAPDSNGEATDEDFARVLRRLDTDFQVLLDAVKATGQDTLVILTSDNGPEHFQGDPVSPGPATPPSLRGQKRQVLEGGIRVPGVFWWPSTIRADSSSDQVAGIIDLLPTLLDIWGLTPPDSRPLDGESLLPTLTEVSLQRENGLYFSYKNPQMNGDLPLQQAYIDPTGQWKLARSATFDQSNCSTQVSLNTSGTRPDAFPYAEDWVLWDIDSSITGNPRECNDLGPMESMLRTMLINDWSDIANDVLSIDANLNQRTARDFPYFGPDGPASITTQVFEEFDEDDYPEGFTLSTSTGFQTVVNSPPDFTSGMLRFSNGNNPIPALVIERQYATIENDLFVNASGADYTGSPVIFTNTGTTPTGSATVLAESIVFSYLLHFDPGVGFDPLTDIAEATSTIEFEHDILGIIWEDSLLKNSDKLAFAQPNFRGTDGARSMILARHSFCQVREHSRSPFGQTAHQPGSTFSTKLEWVMTS